MKHVNVTSKSAQWKLYERSIRYLLKYVKYWLTCVKLMINAILRSTNPWEAMQVSWFRLSLAKNILFLMIFSIWKLDIPIFLIVITFEKSLESYKHQTEIFNLFHKLFVISVTSSSPQISLTNLFLLQSSPSQEIAVLSFQLLKLKPTFIPFCAYPMSVP